MKIEIMKNWGKIFLDLDAGNVFTSVLVLDQWGIEKCFVGDPALLSLDGYYIANEDSSL